MQALALCAMTLLPIVAWAQDPPPLILRPRVVPDPVAEVQAACAECQPHADEYNRIARRINDLNFQLAHRRREVDLQRQAIAQVEAEIAQLQSTSGSAARDARMATARQRLDAYREQLRRAIEQVAEVERQVTDASAALAAAQARLQACEETCRRAAEQSSAAAAQQQQATPSAGSTGSSAGSTTPTGESAGATTGSPTDRPRWRSDAEIERDRIETEKLDATLKAMTGDQWAAEFAAFFTSTLFDTDTPFDTAYGQNLRTLQQANAPTQEQIYADAALADQNARVAAQRAVDRQTALDSAGQMLEHGYTRDARGLIGPGYPDLASAGDAHKTAALMTQDAHMGQLLQFRANLHTIKIGDGTISPGSFVNLSGAASFTRLAQINQELGFLRANDGDEERIAALEAERTQLLTIDGLAPSDGLIAARTGLIEGLAGLSANVYEAYWTWIGFKEGGLPDKYGNLPLNEAAARYEAEAAQYENVYLTALGKSPFLGAMVDPTGSGDPIPFWQYLTSTESPWSAGHYPSSYAFVATGPRDPAVDQVALTQAIDFLDDASAQVIDQFGTIVTTVPLLDAYGSPVFAPLRTQVIGDLSLIYPNITANMALLSSQYDANTAATAHTRVATDAAIAGVQIIVGGVIFVFPFTAPVLVPVEIALTGGTVGLEGFRLYYAWQDLQQAEQAAAVGAGASIVGVLPYRDLFRAQVGSFVVVAATAPLSAGASLMSLESAQNQMRLAAAAADTPAATTGTRVAKSAAADAVAQTVPDFATFQAMRPAEQVAAIKGLPENIRAQLISQLGGVEKKLFVIAWEKDIVDARLIASVREGNLWNERVNGNLQTVTDKTRSSSDQEILDRIYRRDGDPEQLTLNRDALSRYFDEVGDDVVGPFSSAPPFDEFDPTGLGLFPQAGYYTSKMSEAEIAALLAKTGELTPEEILLKTDLLLRGYGRPVLEVNDPTMTLAEIQALFAKADPTAEEVALKADLVSRGWGRTNVRGDVAGWNTVPGAMPNTSGSPPSPFNPFATFGPAGEFDSKVGTLGGAGDSGLSGATEAVPGRARNPNRTALLDDPDLPPDTLILEPFTPPAAGLLDLPADLRGLLHGDPLPNSLWNVPTPAVLREPKPFVFEPHPPLTPASGPAQPVTINTTGAVVPSVGTTQALPLGTIVHFTPPPPGATPPWIPFVTKVIPIGCRFMASSQVPACDETTHAVVLNYPAAYGQAVGGMLRTTPGFVFTEGDELRFVQAPDPYFASRGSWGQSYDDQWAVKQIGLDQATARRRPAVSGTPVTVAVIDTGVAWNHVDLTPRDLWTNAREIAGNHKDDDGNGYVDDIVGWNFVDDNNLPWDFNGHGTLVAGIIAAGRDNGVGIAGVNPGARIMALKAMDEHGRGRASLIAEAIVYAASNGARVVNLSVGGRRLTRTEQLAIEYAYTRGSVVVVAAGNDGIDIADYGPGGLRRALTVTATDSTDHRLPGANFGTSIDLAAPGLDVLGPRAIGTDLHTASRVKDYRHGTNVVGSDAGYIRATGTSFAAPLVAGVASLLIGANPSLSAAQVERMLLQSARDIESPGIDPLTGYGRLDAAAALTADPDFFVEAVISKVDVATTPRGPVARVIGTADGDRFAVARIEIGKGEQPSAWIAVGDPLSKSVRDAPLAEISAAAFQGSAVWTLRVVARHANGRSREGRFLLRLK
jgi:subtilisin family serine protease